MEINWDEAKAEASFKKHGVLFDEAATVLTNPLAETYIDDQMGEERYITIGHSPVGHLLFVVWCECGKSEIRVISSRKATKKERVEYEKRIRP